MGKSERKLKKGLTTSTFWVYNKEKTREVKIMAKIKTQGWYIFADGYEAWYHGLSAQEKKIEIYKHGAIIKFEPTN
jgi:hypothetical protein